MCWEISQQILCARTQCLNQVTITSGIQRCYGKLYGGPLCSNYKSTPSEIEQPARGTQLCLHCLLYQNDIHQGHHAQRQAHQETVEPQQQQASSTLLLQAPDANVTGHYLSSATSQHVELRASSRLFDDFAYHSHFPCVEGNPHGPGYRGRRNAIACQGGLRGRDQRGQDPMQRECSG